MGTKKFIFYGVISFAVITGSIYGYSFLKTFSGGGEIASFDKSVDVIGTFFDASNNIQSSQNEKEEYRQYLNTVRGFSLRYPKELSVKEYDEGDETYTILFEDKTGEKGFQIFFTPYKYDTIVRSRILKDVPSGKFTEPVEVIISSGIRALAFFSEGNLGRMREIWFLHNGYLYEATSYANLDDWLAEIMQTWQF